MYSPHTSAPRLKKRRRGGVLPRPRGRTLWIRSHQCKYARARRGGRPCPPGDMHPANTDAPMQTRTMFVGVDAHIDPRRTHFRFYETSRQNGRAPRADRVVRPYRDVTWSPILRAALRLRVAGSMWASTPTDISCIRRSLCGFVAAPCAGGVEPRPYGAAGGNFTKSPACYFAANPVK